MSAPVLAGARRGPWLGVAAAALALGCADVESAAEAPPAASPDGLGPYAVGVTTFHVPGAEGGRTLPVEVWYPADDLAAFPVAQYALQIGPLELARIASPLGARRDVPADRRGAPYPVVLFSHGNGGVRFQSVYLTEYLATHGFVVAAPDHVGNTFAEQVNSASALPTAEAARVRPSDISLTLDGLLEQSAQGSGVLRALVDAERVGVAGHSFGGYTAFRVAGATMDPDAVTAACSASGDLLCDGWDELAGPFPASARDDRVRAALPQAPGGAVAFMQGGNGFGDVTIPTMVQGGTIDQTTPFEPESKAPFESLGGEGYLLGVEGAGHFTFSNMCDLVEILGLMVEAFDDGCGPTNIDPAEAHALINRYATAFLQSYVAGDPSFAGFLDAGQELPAGVATFEVR